MRNGPMLRILPAILVLPLVHDGGGAPLPPWKEHYENRCRRFARENLRLKNVVFVGDSLTEGFPLERYFPGIPVLNRGIVSDTVGRVGVPGRGLLHRMDLSIFDCNPRAVFLLIGANDLGDYARNGEPTPEEIVASYREVLRRIHERLPELPVYVQSCLPAGGKYAHLNPGIREFNERIRKLAEELGYPYVDLHPLFEDERGELKPELTRDGLHINEKGYALWAEKIRPLVNRAAGVE